MKTIYLKPDSTDYQIIRMNAPLMASTPEEPTGWNDGSVDDDFNNVGEF